MTTYQWQPNQHKQIITKVAHLLFRKLNPSNLEKFLLDAEWVYNNTRKSVRYHKPKRIPRKEEKAKTIVKL